MNKDIFKDNQEYLTAFFERAGVQKRNAWEPPEPVEKKKAKKPAPAAKPPTKAELLKNFQMKVRRTLKAGLALPLEAIAKKHKLSFTEKAILAHFAGSELYRVRPDLSTLILKLETAGIAPAFETLQLLSPDSPLVRGKLMGLTPRDSIRYGCDDLSMPDKIFTEITGVRFRKPAPKKRQARVKGAGSPGQIYDSLARYVVGQDQAKKAVAAGVFLHLQRAELNKRRPDQEKIPKSNILIIGPTGSGKTHICRTLSNSLNLPFLASDATQYTETGYVGKCVDEMILDLHKGRNLPPAPKAIIYVDEIDKIAERSIGGQRDVSGRSVQEELLKLLEGQVLTVERQRSMSNSSMTVDISNILFIAGGAFHGLEAIISERLKKKGIGFRGASSEEKPDQRTLLRHVQPEDLIAYGLMPEFIGRFPVIAVLDKLTREEMLNIITGTQNSLLGQYKAVIEKSGLDIEIPADLPERVAEEALRRDLGARAIRSIMEKWLTDRLFAAGGQQQPPAGPEPLEGSGG